MLMTGRRKVPTKLKNTPVTTDRVGNRASDYDDITTIREIMRKSALSRPNLYIPKERQWHRFARRSEESQK